MNGTIAIFCGEMPVLATDDPLIHRTAELPCGVTITLADGTEIKGTITYPECDVRFNRPGWWLVDKVTATGTLENGWQIAVTLLPEWVKFDGPGKRTALEVNGKGAIWNADGLKGTIALVSPEVESYRGEIGEFIVNSCVETGDVTFV